MCCFSDAHSHLSQPLMLFLTASLPVPMETPLRAAAAAGSILSLPEASQRDDRDELLGIGGGLEELRAESFSITHLLSSTYTLADSVCI